jgi:hypothetical protein
VSARINENGVEMKELWLEQGFRDLFVKYLKLEGL